MKPFHPIYCTLKVLLLPLYKTFSQHEFELQPYAERIYRRRIIFFKDGQKQTEEEGNENFGIRTPSWWKW